MIFLIGHRKKIKFFQKFDYVDAQGNLHLNTKISEIENIKEYGCGIYTFKKE
jgi:hypothetical protein